MLFLSSETDFYGFDGFAQTHKALHYFHFTVLVSDCLGLPKIFFQGALPVLEPAGLENED